MKTFLYFAFSSISVHALRLPSGPSDASTDLSIDKEEWEEFVFADEDGIPSQIGKDISKQRLQTANKGLSFGLGCSTPNLKVAVCVAGLSRNFATSTWTSAFQSSLIAPISEAGARGMAKQTPDVFVHVTLGEGPIASDRQHSDRDHANTKEYILQALKEIHPTNFSVEERNGAGYSFSALGDPSCYRALSQHAMAYYHSISGCYEQVQAKEAESKSKYDFVIFLRPDGRFEQSSEYLKSVQCKKSLYIADRSSFQQRQHADVFGNIWKNEFLNPHPDLCHTPFLYSEKFILKALKDMKGDKVYVGQAKGDAKAAAQAGAAPL